ncbi:hypothetical protein [Embleya sp. MST-111070]|uniref:hypothetical protein n=1 Tax=Embleya sp. MST-111070 TaxID=3398231 RepID=UPI003F73F3C3
MSTYREGEYVEPVNEAVREVRRPGQILMAQPLRDAEQTLTVMPFGGGVMWSMPSSSVQRTTPPGESTP